MSPKRALIAISASLSLLGAAAACSGSATLPGQSQLVNQPTAPAPPAPNDTSPFVPPPGSLGH